MDLKMAKEDEVDFRNAGVEAFVGDHDLERMLRDIGLPRTNWPRHDLRPVDAWDHALLVLGDGAIPEGQFALLARALKDRPRHPVFLELSARYTTPASPQPRTVPAPGAAANPARGAGTDEGWDLFISYTQPDRPWAEWITWVLEEDRRWVLFQDWDFVAGTHWTARIQDGVTRAPRMICVLSDSYLKSTYCQAEWQAMFRRDPRGDDRRLVTARIENCARPGLIDDVVGCDLFGLSEPQARETLLQCVEGAERGRLKPATPPPFPAERAVPGPVAFPGNPSQG